VKDAEFCTALGVALPLMMSLVGTIPLTSPSSHTKITRSAQLTRTKRPNSPRDAARQLLCALLGDDAKKYHPFSFYPKVTPPEYAAIVISRRPDSPFTFPLRSVDCQLFVGNSIHFQCQSEVARWLFRGRYRRGGKATQALGE